MRRTNPQVDAYFAKAEKWRAELAALRRIVLDCPLSEELKWHSPCYTFERANVVAIWGLKDHCGLAFFKGVLLKDPDGILVAPGKHSRSVRKIAFTSVAEIVALEVTLKAYIHAAIEVEMAGLRVDLPKDDLAPPPELRDRLADDPALRAAFAALTPGRRRAYILHISQPKQAKTRVSRIEKCAPRILAGKGLHDR